MARRPSSPSAPSGVRPLGDKAENRTTEQIDNTSTLAAVNSANQLTSLSVGGALSFEGSTSEAATVTVGGQPAATTATNEFVGKVAVTGGTQNVTVTAVDPGGATRTNTYSVSTTGTGKTFTYDDNGNMTSDGTRGYEWDAINQLVAINQGVNRSEFTYDGWGKRVRMVEKVSGATTSDRRFVWCGMEICEERGSDGTTVVKRFFSQGVQESGTALFYATDHLGSVRELMDTAGAVRARYGYDPYGRTTKVSGDKNSDYTYAGLFAHSASGLHLAVFRAYDSNLGRWISGDPIEFAGGSSNFYGYIRSRPVSDWDPLGLLSPCGGGMLLTKYSPADYKQMKDGIKAKIQERLPNLPPAEVDNAAGEITMEMNGYGEASVIRDISKKYKPEDNWNEEDTRKGEKIIEEIKKRIDERKRRDPGKQAEEDRKRRKGEKDCQK